MSTFISLLFFKLEKFHDRFLATDRHHEYFIKHIICFLICNQCFSDGRIFFLFPQTLFNYRNFFVILLCNFLWWLFCFDGNLLFSYWNYSSWNFEGSLIFFLSDTENLLKVIVIKIRDINYYYIYIKKNSTFSGNGKFIEYLPQFSSTLKFFMVPIYAKKRRYF